MKRKLLITCDDFGMHETINEAIIEILLKGYINSASIMPTGQHFLHAVELLKDYGINRVGVHCAITSEYPKLPLIPLSAPSEISSILSLSGSFFEGVHDIPNLDPMEIDLEVRRQIQCVLDHGLQITHLDGHMFFYEHTVPSVTRNMLKIAEELGVPLRLRHSDLGSPISRATCIWDGYDTQEVRFRFYENYLKEETTTLTELIIHPAMDIDKISQFSESGPKRRGDFDFFTSNHFYKLLETHKIEVCNWPSIVASPFPLMTASKFEL